MMTAQELRIGNYVIHDGKDLLRIMANKPIYLEQYQAFELFGFTAEEREQNGMQINVADMERRMTIWCKQNKLIWINQPNNEYVLQPENY